MNSFSNWQTFFFEIYDFLKIMNISVFTKKMYKPVSNSLTVFEPTNILWIDDFFFKLGTNLKNKCLFLFLWTFFCGNLWTFSKLSWTFFSDSRIWPWFISRPFFSNCDLFIILRTVLQNHQHFLNLQNFYDFQFFLIHIYFMISQNCFLKNRNF